METLKSKRDLAMGRQCAKSSYRKLSTHYRKNGNHTPKVKVVKKAIHKASTWEWGANVMGNFEPKGKIILGSKSNNEPNDKSSKSSCKPNRGVRPKARNGPEPFQAHQPQECQGRAWRFNLEKFAFESTSQKIQIGIPGRSGKPILKGLGQEESYE